MKTSRCAWVASLFVLSYGISGRTVPLCGSPQGAGGPGIVTLSPNSGHSLSRPQVTLVFWGSQWTSGGYGTETWGQIAGAIQDMMNGPYFSGLSQYGNAGIPRLVPAVVFDHSDPPNPFCTLGMKHSVPPNPTCDGKAGVSSVVTLAMSNHYASPADPKVEMIYVVIIPPNVAFAGGNDNVGGCQTAGGGCHYFDTYNSNQFYFAWVRDQGSLNGNPSTPMAIGHEVAEAITDPSGSDGWRLNDPHDDEIGDACGPPCTNSVGSWYSVQGYYSGVDGRCILPAVWSNVVSSSSGWGPIDPQPSQVHQIYGASWGLLATGILPTQAWAWLPASGWNIIASIGAPYVSFGSAFAATDTTAYALSASQDSIWRYQGGLTWNAIDSNLDGNVYGGGPDDVIAVRNYNFSDPFHYTGSSWTQVDTVPINEVAITEQGAYGMTYDHQQIWQETNAGAFQYIASAAPYTYLDLLGGSWMASAVRATSTNHNQIWDFDGTNMYWWENRTSDRNNLASLAVWGTTQGSPQLYTLNPVTGTETLAWSSNPFATAPTWPYEDASGLGRLIGGGASLFATVVSCTPPATRPSNSTTSCP